MRCTEVRTNDGATRRFAVIAFAMAVRIGHADAQSMPRVVGVTATATSAAGSHQPWSVLMPGDASRWCEGQADEGIGETLVLTLATPTRIEKLTIRAGVWESEESFREHNLVTKIDVIADNGRQAVASPPQDRSAVTVAIGGGPVKQLKLRIAEVHRGTVDESCIAGVDLVAPSWTTFLVGLDRNTAAGVEPAVRAIATAFERCDARTFTRLVQFPLPYRRQGDDDQPASPSDYPDSEALVRACKQHAFDALRDMIHRTPDIVSDALGKVLVRYDALAWHLVLDAGKWRLASLDDDKPQ